MCGVYVCVVGEIDLQFFGSPMGLLQTRGERAGAEHPDGGALDVSFHCGGGDRGRQRR